MPAERPAPTYADITPEIFGSLLAFYSDYVLKSFYRTKVKGDDEKRERAAREDEWRYKTFPEAVRLREKDEGMSKEELERLVTWKITHQTNRPFLLPQIRKNDPATVKRCTAEARRLLVPSNLNAPTIEDVKKALNKVCELTGVGPATGTLILSIFDGRNVPFFEDELYAWLCPGSNLKLKYNVKEYLDILEMLEKVKDRVGMSMDAQDFEKVAFVCQHWDLVEDSHKETIREQATTDSGVDEKSSKGPRGGKNEPRKDDSRSDKSAGQRKDPEANAQPAARRKTGTKRKTTAADNAVAPETRRSKRQLK